MPTAMAEKIRLVLVVDEEIRAALRLEAAKRTAMSSSENEVTMSDVVTSVLSEALADTLEEVRKKRQGKRGH